MDPHAAVIEQIVVVVAALQDTVHGLSQGINRQQAPQLSAQEDSQFDMGAPSPPPPPSMTQMAPLPIPQGTPVVIQRSTVVTQPQSTIPVQTIGDDRIQRVEQMLRQLRVAEGMDVWDGFDSAPVTPLPPKFRMLDMEWYTGKGCPRTHLRIYSQFMRGMGLDEA